MTKEEILKAAGFPNTKEGVKAFYKEYDNPEVFFAKHGGSLSGAPHNGQPTADEFFSYGSHYNDSVNVPMGNPFYAAEGGTPYYGGPTRPYTYGGGLPGGANEYDMPCMNCGGYMEEGGDYNSPTNYGSFNVAMKNGGSLKKYQDVGEVKFKTPYSPEGPNINKFFNTPQGKKLTPDEKFAAEEQIRLANRFGKKPVTVGSRVDPDLQAYDTSDTESDIMLYKNPETGIAGPDSMHVFPGNPNLQTIFKRDKVMVGNALDTKKSRKEAEDFNKGKIIEKKGELYGDYAHNAVYPFETGGVIDPSNNMSYPTFEDGGKYNLLNLIKAASKKMKKAYGGDTVTQGGNSDNYPNSITEAFKKSVANNHSNSLLKKGEENIIKELQGSARGYDMGGMYEDDYSAPQLDPQTAANNYMFEQQNNALRNNFQNNINSLGNSLQYLGYGANPYTKTTVRKAGVGLETGSTTPGASRSMSPAEWEWMDQQRKAKQNEANYARYFGSQGTRGMNFLPINYGYNTKTRISKKSQANLQDLLGKDGKNPHDINSLKYVDKDTLFGHKTKLVLGHRDFYEDNMKIKPVPSLLNNKGKSKKESAYDLGDLISRLKNKGQGQGQSQDLGPYPDATEYDGVNEAATSDNYEHGQLFPKIYKQSPASFMPSNLQKPPSTTPVDMRRDNSFKTGFPSVQTPSFAPTAKKYGGLARAQYGKNHLSPNMADGLYDAAGNLIDNMSPVKMEPINTVPLFNDYVNNQGAALQQQQGHLKDPETGSMYSGPEKKTKIVQKTKMGLDGVSAANATIAGIDTLASGINMGRANKDFDQKNIDRHIADNTYLSNQGIAQYGGSRGDYDPNSGEFRLGDKVAVQFKGNAPGSRGTIKAYGGSFQDGGMQQQQQPDPQQIMQGVATMLQQGAQPEQIAKQLVEMGIPQEQVVQIIQTVMQQLQGGQEGQEEPQQQPMRYGGYAYGGNAEEDEESYEADLNEDEIAELRRGGHIVNYI